MYLLEPITLQQDQSVMDTRWASQQPVHHREQYHLTAFHPPVPVSPFTDPYKYALLSEANQEGDERDLQVDSATVPEVSAHTSLGCVARPLPPEAAPVSVEARCSLWWSSLLKVYL